MMKRVKTQTLKILRRKTRMDSLHLLPPPMTTNWTRISVRRSRLPKISFKRRSKARTLLNLNLCPKRVKAKVSKALASLKKRQRLLPRRRALQ